MESSLGEIPTEEDSVLLTPCWSPQSPRPPQARASGPASYRALVPRKALCLGFSHQQGLLFAAKAQPSCCQGLTHKPPWVPIAPGQPDTCKLPDHSRPQTPVHFHPPGSGCGCTEFLMDPNMPCPFSLLLPLAPLQRGDPAGPSRACLHVSSSRKLP